MQTCKIYRRNGGMSGMRKTQFKKGWHELGNGQFAYLQPSGTWGYSNAGLVVDHGEALLVDTLFDERLTAEMLAAMPDVAGIDTGGIGTLVNTHANGDHTYGNRLVHNASIIASRASIHEMETVDAPALIASIMRRTSSLGQVGVYLDAIFGPFDFDSVRMRLPDRTFTGTERLQVGDKEVCLLELGPAHTSGDAIVYVPKDRIVYTGDILFSDGTPIMWAGPVGNWLAACDSIMAMDVECVVPGHGPVTDKVGIGAMRSYLSYLDKEARKRHAAGLTSWEAAQDISLAGFGALEDPERIAVTVDTIYRELNDDRSMRDMPELFGRMATLDRRRNPRRYAALDAAPSCTHSACE